MLVTAAVARILLDKFTLSRHPGQETLKSSVLVRLHEHFQGHARRQHVHEARALIFITRHIGTGGNVGVEVLLPDGNRLHQYRPIRRALRILDLGPQGVLPHKAATAVRDRQPSPHFSSVELVNKQEDPFGRRALRNRKVKPCPQLLRREHRVETIKDGITSLRTRHRRHVGELDLGPLPVGNPSEKCNHFRVLSNHIIARVLGPCLWTLVVVGVNAVLAVHELIIKIRRLGRRRLTSSVTLLRPDVELLRARRLLALSGSTICRPWVRPSREARRLARISGRRGCLGLRLSGSCSIGGDVNLNRHNAPVEIVGLHHRLGKRGFNRCDADLQVGNRFANRPNTRIVRDAAAHGLKSLNGLISMALGNDELLGDSFGILVNRVHHPLDLCQHALNDDVVLLNDRLGLLELRPESGKTRGA